MRMTQKLVDGIALDSDAVIWDHDGLGLRVQAGKRSWVVRYRVAGVSRQKSLPGDLPLKQARIRAAEIRSAAAGGVDVVEAGRARAAEARRKAEAAKAQSLGAIVEAYLADAPRRLRPESLRLAKIYLQKHWRSLHHRPADEISRREIVVVLEGYAGRRTAIQLLRFLSMVLGWGVERGLLEKNATLGIKPPAVAVARERVLSEDELRTILAALDGPCAEGAARAFRVIVRLLLLTGCRRAEIGGAQWSEIDLDRAVFVIPTERSKNARSHALPLSQQAVRSCGAKPLSARTCSELAASRPGPVATPSSPEPLGLPHWTLHDVRRSVATHLAEIGVAPHIIEAVLGHAGHRSGIGGTYNRSTYAAEQRAALQRWADHLDRIVAGDATSNVVELAR